jgi:acetyl/propionyl-CoA carboxylase alpha subunit
VEAVGTSGAVKYAIEIGGREVEADVVPRADGRFGVTVAGRTYVADLRRIGKGPLHSLLVGARSCEVAAIRDDGTWRVDLKGLSFRLRVETAQEHAARVLDATGPSRRSAEVKASMPGFVTRVLIAPGDRVERGTPLLIIEAMKMENEIRAESSGVIAEVTVKERQIVNAGDLLLRIG